MATLPKPAAPTDAEQAIRALAQEFARHYNARDIDQLIALFTRDGRMFAPFQPAAETASVLRQFAHQTFTEFDPQQLSIDTTHVEVSGQLAFSFGHFSMNIRTLNGRRVDDRGKWMVALRREEGTWRIVGHCFNTDLPAKALIGMV